MSQTFSTVGEQRPQPAQLFYLEQLHNERFDKPFDPSEVADWTARDVSTLIFDLTKGPKAALYRPLKAKPVRDDQVARLAALCEEQGIELPNPYPADRGTAEVVIRRLRSAAAQKRANEARDRMLTSAYGHNLAEVLMPSAVAEAVAFADVDADGPDEAEADTSDAVSVEADDAADEEMPF